MNIRDFFNPIIYFLANIFTIIANVFIRRDRSIMLMGAWYGERFGGNSRYLFQYLAENKEKYGLKKVIWSTRKGEIYNELQDMGYDVCMMTSKEGIYYHLKAGIHAISVNSSASNATNDSRKGDLIGELSWGSVRVFTNHGISSIKGNRITRRNELKGVEKIIVTSYIFLHSNKFFRKMVLCPGGWDKNIYLSPASENSRRDQKRHLQNEESIVVNTGVAELCPCIKMTAREEQIIGTIKEHKHSVLYLPTYRTSDDTGYQHPLNENSFFEFLKKNDIFWIDKLHPGAKERMNAKYYDPEYSLKLEPEFDINIIMRDVDVVITDYSTVCYKAAYFDKGVIYYWPDHELYQSKDKGVIKEYSEDLIGPVARTPEELGNALINVLAPSYIAGMQSEYKRIKNTFFDGKVSDYQEICRDLFDAVDNRWDQ